MGSLVTAVAPAVRPSVGGWLAETFGWRAIFSVGLMAGIYVVFALGQGLMYGTNMTCALGFLPAGVKADGNAMFTTLQQLSGAVGTNVTAAVVNDAQAGVAADGMAAATLAGTQTALVVLVAAVAVALACAVLETGLAARRG